MADFVRKQLISVFARQAGATASQRCSSLGWSNRSIATAATGVHDSASQETNSPTWQPYRYELDVEPQPKRRRIDQLRTDPAPRSFSSFLTDNYSRQHNYLRISVTERCNLRCLYCMPEEGIQLSPPEHNLTSPEIVYLSELFVKQGVDKIRLTGGEPTVRKDIVSLMQQIGGLRSLGLKELCITTNGISLHRKLDSMVESGLTGVNLSLDTLDPFQFTLMTRRNGHEAVMKSIARILEMNKHGAGVKLKINCVVMKGLNEREILPFVELGREKDLEVRFIEYMPFDGNKWSEKKMMPYKEMLATIQAKYPAAHRVQDHANDTSKTYKIPGFVGRFGFITSMTHNFCGTCNRLRITSDGNLKVCLFGNAEVSLRDILRESNEGKPIDIDAMAALRQLESNCRETLRSDEGDVTISERDARLLDVIGMAVKRKKEKHAGIEFPSASQVSMNQANPNQTRPPDSDLNPLLPRRSTQPRIVPMHMLPTQGQLAGVRLPSTVCRQTTISRSGSARPFTTARMSKSRETKPKDQLVTGGRPLKLTHLNDTGAAHMVDISAKRETSRAATAVATLLFSDSATYTALVSQELAKGDAIAVARVAVIQAAKKTADLIPLAHPSLGITAISVDIETFSGTECSITTSTSTAGKQLPSVVSDKGGVRVLATVKCEGKTGIEMEAITAASMGAITLYDMLKAVDKGMVITGARVIRKVGGKSGAWSWDESTNELVKDGQSLIQDLKASQQIFSSATKSVGQPPLPERDVDQWNEGLAAEFMIPEMPTKH